MKKPDWVLWGDAAKIVTLEECVCLSLDAEPTEIFTPKPKPESVRTKPLTDRPNGWAAPVVVYSGDHLTQQQRNERLALTHEALLSPEGVKRLAKLRLHFDEGSRRLPPAGQRSYYGYEEKRVKLLDFARWAYAMKWSVPEPLDLTPKPAITAPVPVAMAEPQTAPSPAPAPPAAPLVADSAPDGVKPMPNLSWWRVAYDIHEMAQNIGAARHSKGERTSNTEIAKEIAKRIQDIERSRASDRRPPNWDTIRGVLTGWTWRPE